MVIINEVINVSIIDDDISLLKKINEDFKNDSRINLFWAGTDYKLFLEKAVHKTDILLLDIMLDDISGEQLIEVMCNQNPMMEILIYTNVEEEDILLSCIKKGVSGYVLKSVSHEDLARVLLAIYNGGAFLSPVMAKKMLKHFNTSTNIEEDNSLNKSEFQILKLLSDGYSYKLISDKMNISIDSVRYYIKGLYKKLQVNSKGEAISMYLRNKT